MTTTPITLTQAITADTPTNPLTQRPHCTLCGEPGNITHEGITLNTNGTLTTIHWCSDPTCIGVRRRTLNIITRPITTPASMDVNP